MSLDDRYVTPTPEGVSLDVALAGLGSRFGAIALDMTVQTIVFVGLVIAVGLITANGDSAIWPTAILLAGFVVIYPGYYIFCEVAFSGRTLGKAAVGIRVVTTAGLAVGFWASLLRNVARLVDLLPSMYLVGVVSILATSRNQRVGDMLAGTIVVRVRHAADMIARGQPYGATAWATPLAGFATIPAGDTAALALVDVSAVSDEEISLVHHYFARRAGYTSEARERLAASLVARLAPRVRGVTATDPEAYLATVAQARALRR